MLLIGEPNYEEISSNSIGRIIVKVAKPEEKQLTVKRKINEWNKNYENLVHEKFED
jgi:hypothetical protein